MNALQRRIRREANKLIARRRYRERKAGLPVSVRPGPSKGSDRKPRKKP